MVLHQSLWSILTWFWYVMNNRLRVFFFHIAHQVVPARYVEDAMFPLRYILLLLLYACMCCVVCGIYLCCMYVSLWMGALVSKHSEARASCRVSSSAIILSALMPWEVFHWTSDCPFSARLAWQQVLKIYIKSALTLQVMTTVLGFF